MKHLKFIIAYLLLLFNFIALAQKDVSKYAIGVNFVPLYSGTPELQLDYFPSKYVGFCSSAGYTYKALRGGFVKVGDDAEIDELKGYYFKAGLKFRSPSNSKKHVCIGFAQINYIYSAYNETGRSNSSIPNSTILHLKGFSNAFSVSIGFEWRIINYLFLRGGLQNALSFRRDHLGYSGHTLQPGLGASGILFNEQLILGLAFKFSELKNKTD
jgi:hypothetical protein